jgi:hypothetical protein
MIKRWWKTKKNMQVLKKADCFLNSIIWFNFYLWNRASWATSSKMACTFILHIDEHSRYIWALISWQSAKPCSQETGFILLALRTAIVSGSSRKSIFVPTKTTGVAEECCLICGFHLHLTLSNDSGRSIEKQTIKIFTSGNKSGRKWSKSSVPAVSEKSKVNQRLRQKFQYVSTPKFEMNWLWVDH